MGEVYNHDVDLKFSCAVNVLDSVGIHKVTIRSIWDLTPPPQDGMQQSGTLHI